MKKMQLKNILLIEKRMTYVTKEHLHKLNVTLDILESLPKMEEKRWNEKVG